MVRRGSEGDPDDPGTDTNPEFHETAHTIAEFYVSAAETIGDAVNRAVDAQSAAQADALEGLTRGVDRLLEQVPTDRSGDGNRN